MTMGEKLSKLRRENNYTQEQLAEVLGVSRQAISKWESNVAFPETEKLIRLSEMYGCSLDYLLKDGIETDYTGKMSHDQKTEEDYIKYDSIANGNILFKRGLIHERKSERTIWGMPLWHIGKNAHGVFACGVKASGVVALGVKAKGIVSVGYLSIGVFSFGMLSLGVLALGSLAVGLLAMGAFAFGVISLGAISFGIVSIGAVAVGEFSAGAMAIGRYVAIGDEARGAIAIGDSRAIGSIFQKVGKLTAQEMVKVKQLIDATVPGYLGWAKEIIKMFL